MRRRNLLYTSGVLLSSVVAGCNSQEKENNPTETDREQTDGSDQGNSNKNGTGESTEENTTSSDNDKNGEVEKGQTYPSTPQEVVTRREELINQNKKDEIRNLYHSDSPMSEDKIANIDGGTYLKILEMETLEEGSNSAEIKTTYLYINSSGGFCGFNNITLQLEGDRWKIWDWDADFGWVFVESDYEKMGVTGVKLNRGVMPRDEIYTKLTTGQDNLLIKGEGFADPTRFGEELDGMSPVSHPQDWPENSNEIAVGVWDTYELEIIWDHNGQNFPMIATSAGREITSEYDPRKLVFSADQLNESYLGSGHPTREWELIEEETGKAPIAPMRNGGYDIENIRNPTEAERKFQLSGIDAWDFTLGLFFTEEIDAARAYIDGWEQRTHWDSFDLTIANTYSGENYKEMEIVGEFVWNVAQHQNMILYGSYFPKDSDAHLYQDTNFIDIITEGNYSNYAPVEEQIVYIVNNTGIEGIST